MAYTLFANQALTPQVINNAGGHRQFLVFKPKMRSYCAGIHKRNCNGSITVWENTGKADETGI
jgi:hypothetical protein